MKKYLCILVAATQIASCATYEKRAIPFKHPETYYNFQNASGLLIGAEAFTDKKSAGEIFGFDIRGAGILPVQVVFENKSGQNAEVISGQTFLIDKTGNYWKILSFRDAVNRVEQATSSGAIAEGTGKGAAVGASIGALLGLAIGVVSGRGAGEAVLKGGVLGGAGGAVIGGAGKAGDSGSREYGIAGDLREKGIEGKVLTKNSIANGFIFFPGEALSASELRLQIRFISSGVSETIKLKVQ